MEQPGRPDASSPSAGPVWSGPVTGGAGSAVIGAGRLDLAARGYVEEEFFVEGSAHTFSATAPLSSDGRWAVRPHEGPGEGLRYRTRILVRRPDDVSGRPAVVAVEWLNVSGGLDADPDWTSLHEELIRSGTIWVGVSAQHDGIFPGADPIGELLALVRADPERYGSLEHPGDDASYDLFTQVGRLLRRDAAGLLGGAVPDVVVALGESQSAERLTTYVNAFGRDGAFDAYFLHSRHAVSSPLRDGDDPAPDPTLVRDDLEVPVMVLSAENDVAGARIGYGRARQPDTERFVAWEVAGAAHVDAYGLGIGDLDDGSGDADERLFAAMSAPSSSVYGGVIECGAPINAGPHTYVARAAFAHLVRWARGGPPPPSMPRLRLDATGLDVLRDDLGIALGGVRTPQVDVPVATLSGMGQEPGGFCELFGTTTPLSPEELRRRHPQRDGFVRSWLDALDRAVAAGTILSVDADRLRRIVHAGAPGD